MIHVQRSAEPKVLRDNQNAWAQELCALRSDYYQEVARCRQTQAVNTLKTPNALKKHYGHRAVKEALKHMFGNKCCYCESMTDAVSYRPVEHFRPQSIYPALAYKWTNLLYACERCNVPKKEKFPLEPSGLLAKLDERFPCKPDDTDAGMLIDPCIDDPGNHFEYAFPTGANGQIDVVLVCKTCRAKESCKVYDLIREDLNDARREHVKSIRNTVDLYFLAEAIQDAAKMDRYGRDLKIAITATKPYSAMSRAYIERYRMLTIA